MELSPDAAERAGRVRYLLLDVDGVLTDGRILMLPGVDEDETKAFHSRDGLGIRLALDAGLGVGLLTGRTSSVVARRAGELGVSDVIQGASPKLPEYRALRDRRGLGDEAFCYVGDDLVDLAVMARVGLPATVADAPVEVRDRALLVSSCPGGRGAVREIIEAILRCQGHWQRVVSTRTGETP